MEDRLILVDLHDKQIGTCGKLEAHEKGLLHRAFSIFIFLRDAETGIANRLLIQKRAAGKYHSAGKWANSCCSHPREGETLQEAVCRRLPDETGITADRCPLTEEGSFIYRAVFENGLTEYEYDHVFVGFLKADDAAFERNPEEADEMRFVDLDWLCEDVKDSPGNYAPWFITALPMAMRRLERKGE